jgi:hypothetical protein
MVYMACKYKKNKESGGEGGIRTLDTGFSPYNGLANRRLQPLGHLSGVGFQQFNTRPSVYLVHSCVFRPRANLAKIGSPLFSNIGNRRKKTTGGDFLR